MEHGDEKGRIMEGTGNSERGKGKVEGRSRAASV